MSVTFQVTGDKEVIDKLRELRSSMQKRVVEGAGRAALKPVTADVRARCPVSVNGGHLRKSIGVKKSKKSAPGEIVLSVGARFGYGWTDADGKKHDPFYYSIPVEYGHVVKNPKTGKVVGFVPPSGAFRGAYERNRDRVVETFADELAARIEKALA